MKPQTLDAVAEKFRLMNQPGVANLPALVVDRDGMVFEDDPDDPTVRDEVSQLTLEPFYAVAPSGVPAPDPAVVLDLGSRR